MAQPTNTFETYDAVGNREILADTIYMTTPDKTPFISLIGKSKVAGIYPEWQTDVLATPDTTNNQPEGNDWSFNQIVPTTRVGNYCQISDKRFTTSGTQDVVSKAGRKSEIARELTKKGTELRIDMEAILLSNQASNAGTGNGASNRRTGSLRAWIATNDLLGSGGASGGFNTSTKVVDAATNGTQRAFTKTLIDQAMAAATATGGTPTTMMTSLYTKQVFSTFMSDANVATQRTNQNVVGARPTTIVAAADFYISDFGTIAVVPNVQMTRAGASVARNVYLIDPSMLSVGFLRDFNVVEPAKTGDAEKRVINVEYALVVNNEATQACIADVFGLTASS